MPSWSASEAVKAALPKVVDEAELGELLLPVAAQRSVLQACIPVLRTHGRRPMTWRMT